MSHSTTALPYRSAHLQPPFPLTLTEQRDLVLQKLVVAGREDAHWIVWREAPLPHQALTGPHQGRRELRGVDPVVPPTSHAICNS